MTLQIEITSNRHTISSEAREFTFEIEDNPTELRSNQSENPENILQIEENSTEAPDITSEDTSEGVLDDKSETVTLTPSSDGKLTVLLEIT